MGTEMASVLAAALLASTMLVAANGQPINLDDGATQDPRELREAMDDAEEAVATSKAKRYSYHIVNSFDHRVVWTEGLSFVNGDLYESTGPNPNQGPKGGSLSHINVESGKAVKEV